MGSAPIWFRIVKTSQYWVISTILPSSTRKRSQAANLTWRPLPGMPANSSLCVPRIADPRADEIALADQMPHVGLQIGEGSHETADRAFELLEVRARSRMPLRSGEQISSRAGGTPVVHDLVELLGHRLRIVTHVDSSLVPCSRTTEVAPWPPRSMGRNPYFAAGSCGRWSDAKAAASVRLRRPSLARMLLTW